MTTIINRVRRALAPSGTEPTRKTYARAGGKELDWFARRDRDRTLLNKYRTIYDQGGLISEAIDLYPLYMLGQGYTLQGDKTAASQVQAVFNKVGIEDIWWEQIIDALVIGDGFVENVFGRGGAEDRLVGLATIPSETIEIDADGRGVVTGYRQVLGGSLSNDVSLAPKQVTDLRFISVAGSKYGKSLIGRALDDIQRDTKTAESTAEAIHRHGYPKYHIAVNESGEHTVSDEEMDAIEAEFEDIEKNNEFVTNGPVRISPLDAGGVQHLSEYNDITLQRLIAALGVPEELLGLRRGSTDATAVSRIEAFYKKIGLFQRRLAACYNRNVIDRITGRPGVVKLVFNDASPKDEMQVSQMLSTIMGATPMDPFAVISRRWAQNRLGVDPDEWEKEEGEK